MKAKIRVPMGLGVDRSTYCSSWLWHYSNPLQNYTKYVWGIIAGTWYFHSWALTHWSVTSGTGLTKMLECRCRTKRRKLTENERCRTELFIGIPASMHVHCPDTCCIIKAVLCVYAHAACPCPYRNAGIPDCPASSQSGTGLKKTNNAGTGPVPD
jgi:hypothetical protein